MAHNDKKFTDEQLLQDLAEGLNNSEIGRKYGASECAVRTRKKKLASMGLAPDCGWSHKVPEGFVIHGKSEYLDEYGNVIRQWVKTSVDKEKQLELIQEAVKAMCEDLPKITPVTVMNEHLINETLLAVYPLGDPHVGMLSWDEETGQSWDLKTAEEIFCKAFAEVVRTSPRCDECLIVNLGDFFHYDNMQGVTSRNGHSLDVDGRYIKMIRVGIKIIRQMITTALKHHKRVKVINVIGNHDDVGAQWLSAALSGIYENEPRVTIDDKPAPHHYHRFGKVLIGAHHGHTTKMDKLPSVMASDRAVDWGATEFRYWLTGHIHHDSKKEFPGCMVESFRTLAAKDAYAAWGGWRSGQDTKVLIYHKEYGEVSRNTVNIKMFL